MLSSRIIFAAFLLNFHWTRVFGIENELLDRSQYSMPSVGLGTAGLREKTSEIVKSSILDFGVRLIDTAQATEWYREADIGRALTEVRDSGKLSSKAHVVVVTKIHPRSFSMEKMREKVAESIQILYDPFKNGLLETSLVILLHSPRCWSGHCTPEEEAVNWRTGWKNLETLKRELSDKISAIGVSNFHYDELNELVTSLANEKVSIVQNWYRPQSTTISSLTYTIFDDIAGWIPSTMTGVRAHSRRTTTSFTCTHLPSFAVFSSTAFCCNLLYTRNIFFLNHSLSLTPLCQGILVLRDSVAGPQVLG
jgi:diketogulonate reductase-like aldo/keto reductase